MATNHYDHIVLGLGGMGSAAVRHLAGRGHRVLGLEQYAPPHDRGSSHGETRVVRKAYFEHPAYVPLLQRAYELWQGLEEASGMTLLNLCGGLMMGAPDSAVVAGSLRSAREHGLPHELLDAGAIRRRWPCFDLSEGAIGLFEQSAGFVRCEEAIRAHLQVAAAAGAELRFREAVLDWKDGDGHVSVTTAAGHTYSADRLIITPGPWAPGLLRGLGIPVSVERQVLLWFQPQGGVASFAPEQFPIYIWQERPGVESYGFPAVNGPEGGMKVAFFHSPVREVVTPETVDRAVRPEDISSLRATLRQFFPALDGAFLRGSVCLYSMTPDQHFIIGPHPHHPRVIVAAGFSGHGYKFCPVIGEILADLACEGRTGHDITMFSPERSAAVAGR